MSDASLAISPPASGHDARGLFYPYADWFPQPGALHSVAEGLWWLRMPLPMGLDHINLWILDDGDGWTLVDTGLNKDICRDIWESLLSGFLAGRPVRRVIVTHFHPDHLGMAGWLCARTGAELWMTRTEFLFARMMMLDAAPMPPAAVVAFYARSGWPADQVERLRATRWDRFAQMIAPLPYSYTRMQDGDSFAIGGRQWRVVIGRGHAPEHACLVCDADRLMIAGDQVLPRITSNVSVFASEPDADPLGDWIASIDRLRVLHPATFVLPAHNEPFERLHVRLDQLDADHARKLDALLPFCETPRTAYETFELLFRRPIAEREMAIATGEALAHLHRLERTGHLRRIRDDDVDRFVRI